MTAASSAQARAPGPWLLLSSTTFVSCLLLGYLIPRAHPARLWNVRIDHQQSVVKAREISAALGVDISTWEPTATGAADSKRAYFSELHPGDAASRRFTGMVPRLLFAQPGKKDRVVVRLSSAGDVNAWERRTDKKSVARPSAGVPADARKIAGNALRLFTGSDAGAFQPVTDAAPSSGNLLFAWERGGLLTQRFEATVDNDRLVKAELKPVYNRDFDEAFNSRKTYVNWLDGASGILIYIAGTVFAAGLYIYWAVRRGVKQRFVFAIAAVGVGANLASWFNWGRFDETTNITIGDNPASVWVAGLLLFAFLILFYIVLAGAADAVGLSAKMATFRSVLSPAIFNRRAGISALAGFLCGPLLTLLPLWVSSWHLFGSQLTGDYSPELIFSQHPSLEAIDAPISPAVLGLFGIGFGFFTRYVRMPALRFAVLLILGTMLWGSLATPSETSMAPYLIKGLLLYLIYRALFLRFDILAALSAAYSAHIIWTASAMLLQPARTLHVSGLTALTFLASLTVCAALVAWRGRELAIGDSAAAQVHATSQRESLMAEFSIAHRVQQQMLPETPPAIPGCTIAASCQPAREVGGDLFDFLKLPDGRWTIGVGDVSGKGVPAALYMTLTKGLLAATTADSSDLLDIIANVNGHIHSVAERKMFVTMALGAFDPETRSFDHVRAGHNPIVWRRPSENITKLLTVPGIGLGMASDRLFRRATELERIQLQQGDLLAFYSDGLTEAMNSVQEQFGEERLMHAIEEADGLDAGAVRESVLLKVRTFLAGIPAQDDMTLVVLRVN